MKKKFHALFHRKNIALVLGQERCPLPLFARGYSKVIYKSFYIISADFVHCTFCVITRTRKKYKLVLLQTSMTDNLTKKQRSFCMSHILSKWTSQERLVHNYLKGNKIKHKMHPKIEGNPDILLTDKKTAVFLHGCFWHKCPECYKKPKSNKSYWLPKIQRNVKRDEENRKILKANKYKVVIIWEHQVKNDVDKLLKWAKR